MADNRMFGGERFFFYANANTKALAQKKADSQRKKGYLVRITARAGASGYSIWRR